MLHRLEMKALCFLIFIQLLPWQAQCAARLDPGTTDKDVNPAGNTTIDGNPGNKNTDVNPGSTNKTANPGSSPPVNPGPSPPVNPGPSPPVNPGSSPPVQLRRLPDKVVLDNGLVNLTLSTPGGMMDELGYKGVPNVFETDLGSGDRGCWDLMWSGKGTPLTQDRLASTNFTVIAQDENKVELSFTRTWSSSAKNIPPLNFDRRFVMLRGSPGFYTYSVYERLGGMPATTIAQTRVNVKLSGKLFTFMANSDETQRYMPGEEDREPSRSSDLLYHEARLLTNPINPSMKGEVDDKFQYSKDNKDNVLHGWISDESGVGFWLISPSMEYRTGGPFKQELSSHNGPTALVVFFSSHYSGDEMNLDFQDGEAWKKVYGPVFVYLNSAPTKNVNDLHSTLWTDAKRQALVEQQSWPYSFPMCADYPHADQRGTVRGRLQMSDKYINPAPINAASAYVGLAPKGDEYSWQLENRAYQFWNQTDATGNFFIKAVRPGTYNLYAVVPGHIGRYIIKLDVTVTPGSSADLGNIIHEPPRSGPTLWEIGIPDGSAAEFFIPDPDPKLINKVYINHERYRQYGLWDQYSVVYPKDDVVFNVGQSNYSKDWFFAHVTRKTNNQYHTVTWTINFDLPHVDPSGNYTLQVALASSNVVHLLVFVNEQVDGTPLFRTPGQVGHDNAIARHGIHGLYYLYSVPIPGRTLINGKNYILLNRGPGTDPLVGSMYDYIRLEGPPTLKNS